jgi:hypothetical protein
LRRIQSGMEARLEDAGRCSGVPRPPRSGAVGNAAMNSRLAAPNTSAGSQLYGQGWQSPCAARPPARRGARQAAGVRRRTLAIERHPVLGDFARIAE